MTLAVGHLHFSRHTKLMLWWWWRFTSFALQSTKNFVLYAHGFEGLSLHETHFSDFLRTATVGGTHDCFPLYESYAAGGKLVHSDVRLRGSYRGSQPFFH
uniref:Putative secreted protein n=1 Tax=Anopheles marajoara TaxID=58244 RepID=A0A2M4C9X0_9DIPT